MITGFATDQPFDHLKLYGDFLERETDSAGTVVLHHGRVKRPGKQVPDFVDVELKALTKDTDERLTGIAIKFEVVERLVGRKSGNHEFLRLTPEYDIFIRCPR